MPKYKFYCSSCKKYFTTDVVYESTLRLKMCPQCLEEYQKKINAENEKSARIDTLLWVVIIGVGIGICVYFKGFYETFEIALKGVGVFIGAIVFLFLFCLMVRMCINKDL